jgi:hypothetical protein
MWILSAHDRGEQPMPIVDGCRWTMRFAHGILISGRRTTVREFASMGRYATKRGRCHSYTKNCQHIRHNTMKTISVVGDDVVTRPRKKPHAYGKRKNKTRFQETTRSYAKARRDKTDVISSRQTRGERKVHLEHSTWVAHSTNRLPRDNRTWRKF